MSHRITVNQDKFEILKELVESTIFTGNCGGSTLCLGSLDQQTDVSEVLLQSPIKIEAS
jgi:hypothetical protein